MDPRCPEIKTTDDNDADMDKCGGSGGHENDASSTDNKDHLRVKVMGTARAGGGRVRSVSESSVGEPNRQQRSYSRTVSAAEERVLKLCEQTQPEPFNICIPTSKSDYFKMMSKCVKIGEGAYGEVFSATSEGENVALKIMAIEGSLKVNDLQQKKFEEILSEMVIAKELSDLAEGVLNRSGNFCQVNKLSCAVGEYPGQLLKEWDSYRRRKVSENDRPDNFKSDQLFAVFEFADGGCDIEHYKFTNHAQGLSILKQVVFSLGAAELAMEFEHRDLHLGNVLVRRCARNAYIPYSLNGLERSVRSEGVFATIIDFTISRIKKDGCAVYEDISRDEGFFTGKGDIQFDVYRDMRTLNKNKWGRFKPRTNILWAHYLCKSLLTVIKYADKSGGSGDAEEKLRLLEDKIPTYSSCAQLACDDSVWT